MVWSKNEWNYTGIINGEGAANSRQFQVPTFILLFSLINACDTWNQFQPEDGPAYRFFLLRDQFCSDNEINLGSL